MTFVTRRAKKKTIHKNEKAYQTLIKLCKQRFTPAKVSELLKETGIMGIVSRLWGGALRDEAKNGCEGDYERTGMNNNFHRKSILNCALFICCVGSCIDRETGVIFASVRWARAERALRVRLALFSAWLKNVKRTSGLICKLTDVLSVYYR